MKEWIRENYEDNGRFVAVESGREENGYLDMYLMSRCRHYIIANSSFSWWGAWLGASRDKRIIAPSKWAQNQCYTDIYTENMVRISAKGDLVE